MKPPPDIRWFAGPDGIGHAVPAHGQVARALCGERAQDPRWDHPVQMRHGACLDEVDRLTAEALAGPPETRQ